MNHPNLIKEKMQGDLTYDDESIEFLFMPNDQKNKIICEIYKKLKILDFLCVVLLFTGLILMGIEENLYYYDIQYVVPTYFSELKETINVIVYKNHNEDNYNKGLRIIVLGLTLGFDVIIIKRTSLYLSYMKFREEWEISANLLNTGLLTQLVIEIVYNSLIPFPEVNQNFDLHKDIYPYNMSLDQFCFLLQLGRFYILGRIWGFYSTWNNKKTNEICHLCNAKGGIVFALKATFKEYPLLVVGVYFSMAIVILGISVTISERSFDYFEGSLNWDYYWNGLWMNIIIITTTGYGDYYPRTHIGRLYVCVACVLGPFLNSLMNVTILYITSLSTEQRYAYDRIKYIETAIKLRNLAATSIQLAFKQWKLINLKVTSRKNILDYNRITAYFNYNLVEFKEIRHQFHSNHLEKNIVDMIPQLHNHADYHIPLLAKNFQEINSKINKFLSHIQINQENIRNLLQQVYNNVEDLEKSLKIQKNELTILKLTEKTEESLNLIQFKEIIGRECEKSSSEMLASVISLKNLERNQKESIFFGDFCMTTPRISIDNNIFGYYDIIKQLKKNNKKSLKPQNSNSFRNSSCEEIGPLKSNIRKKINKNLEIIHENEEITKHDSLSNMSINNKNNEKIKKTQTLTSKNEHSAENIAKNTENFNHLDSSKISKNDSGGDSPNFLLSSLIMKENFLKSQKNGFKSHALLKKINVVSDEMRKNNTNYDNSKQKQKFVIKNEEIKE